MSTFHYSLPEQNPSLSLQGLSPEAQAALSHVAIGPSPAERLLEATPEERRQTAQLERSRTELDVFAKQLFPSDTEARGRFVASFDVDWDEEKNEPAIWHLDAETGERELQLKLYIEEPDVEISHLGRKLLLPRHMRLNELHCSDIGITEIAALPEGLKILVCPRNALATLPELPATLEELWCFDNDLTSLPKLPDSLQALSCSRNKLGSLPDLPKGLTFLVCQEAKLQALPDLPSSLKELNCSTNQIEFLPALPEGLTTLSCNGAGLIALPALPAGLKTLNAISNDIAELPLLPTGMKICSFLGNPLTEEALEALRQAGWFSAHPGCRQS